MTGDVVDMAAKRGEHKPSPRAGEDLHQHGRPVGRAGSFKPMARHYPLTCVCTCGTTIDRESPDVAWEHRW